MLIVTRVTFYALAKVLRVSPSLCCKNKERYSGEQRHERLSATDGNWKDLLRFEVGFVPEI